MLLIGVDIIQIRVNALRILYDRGQNADEEDDGGGFRRVVHGLPGVQELDVRVCVVWGRGVETQGLVPSLPGFLEAWLGAVFGRALWAGGVE